MKRAATKKPSARTLMRRPLRDVGELAMLEEILGRKRRSYGRLRAIFAGIGGFIVFMNLVVAPESPNESLGDRFFSLIVVTAFAVFLTPGTVRTRWSHPRLLTAQRRLLRDRGLLRERTPEGLAEEVDEVAAALRRRITAAGGEVSALDRARAAAGRRAAALARAGADDPGRGRGLVELEGFLFRLAEIEIAGLLEPGYYQAQADAAIARAASLLAEP